MSLTPGAWGCGVPGPWGLQADEAVSRALSQTKGQRVTRAAGPDRCCGPGWGMGIARCPDRPSVPALLLGAPSLSLLTQSGIPQKMEKGRVVGRPS